LISPLYLLFAAIGGIVQTAAVFLMRSRGWPFAYTLPLVLVHQFLFTTAYAKAPNFILQWFLTSALTAGLSLLMGLLIFGDRFSLINAIGVLLVFGGLALMKLG
jgi:multidrug transporter EmrE-like cation transporter